MKRLSILAMVAVLASGNLLASDAAVKIVNQSDWDIHELYLSSVDEDDWGPDQLGDDILEANGGRLTLHSIPCDKYDVNLVDEDQDECTLQGVALCGGKDTWVIDNSDLLTCQALTEDD